MDPEDLESLVLKLVTRVTELESTFEHHGIPLASSDIARMQAQMKEHKKEVWLEIDPNSPGLKKP